MATEAQILANRENARHSTGPATPEGKAVCAQNATRHHLTARGLIILPGLEDVFAEFEDELRINLQPIGELEETIFKLILESAWNIERCRQAQAQLYSQAADSGIDPLLDDAIEAKYARIQKYSRQYQNSMFKALRELGRLQTEMMFRQKMHPLTVDELNDPQKFAQTPQAISAVVSLQSIGSSSKRPQQVIVQNRANEARQQFMTMLEHISAPPPLRASKAAAA